VAARRRLREAAALPCYRRRPKVVKAAHLNVTARRAAVKSRSFLPIIVP
jgi:hypothetical protein